MDNEQLAGPAALWRDGQPPMHWTPAAEALTPAVAPAGSRHLPPWSAELHLSKALGRPAMAKTIAELLGNEWTQKLAERITEVVDSRCLAHEAAVAERLARDVGQTLAWMSEATERKMAELRQERFSGVSRG